MTAAEHPRERIRRGVPGSPGIAIGSVHIFSKPIPRAEERTLRPEEIPHELERFAQAMETAKKQLQKVLLFSRQEYGEVQSRILEAQAMILDDPVLLSAIRKRIQSELKNAEFIVNDEIGKYAHLMLAASDEYMHERAYDIEELRNRILRALQQLKLVSKFDGSAIVVAHALTTADTMILTRNEVLGFATDLGGPTSHVAITARQLKIPAVVGLGDASREIENGSTIILDGYSGTLIIQPGPDRIREFEKKRARMLEFEAELAPLRDLPATTTDGRSIELSANIELTEELEYVVHQGSQGVGLFRTESLLVGRDDFPTEEEQYVEYKKVVDRLYPQRVIMRTYDIGGDKVAPEMADESNPFLGWRGIRVSFDRPELFMGQLRAMLRASTRKNLAIMFPMVTTIDEVRSAREYVERAKRELRSKSMRFDRDLQVGVMIEVPAAALNADRIAAEVDFLSIGSNDLIQYLLAVDRGNNLVSRLYQEFNPAVVQMLKHIIDAAHRHEAWVGICGEMAGNPRATPLLLGLGMDELSVVPVMLPEIKKIIRSLSYRKTQRVAEKALAMETSGEINAYLREYLKSEIPDLPVDQPESIPG